MEQGFRASLNWLHAWSGVVLGGLLFAIFWMGTLSVFDREIDRWMAPMIRLPAAEKTFSLEVLRPLYDVAAAAKSPTFNADRGAAGASSQRGGARAAGATARRAQADEDRDRGCRATAAGRDPAGRGGAAAARSAAAARLEAAGKPKPVERPRPPQPTPKSQAAAPQAAPDQTERAAAPAPGATPEPPSASLPTWKGLLLRHLERHKRYPSEAQRARHEGVVYVRFTMSRDGRVLAARIERATGVVSLDQEGLDLLQRAQPLPPLPSDQPGESLELLVPVQFYLKR